MKIGIRIQLVALLLACEAPLGQVQQLSWGKDILLVSSASLTQLAARDRFNHMAPADLSAQYRNDVPFFDRWAIDRYSPAAARLSDVLVIGTLGLPVALSGLSAAGERNGLMTFSKEMVVLYEVLVLNSSLSLFSRSLRTRPRPLVYNPNAPMSERTEGEASGGFFSGHASAAFAAVVYAGYVQGLKKGDPNLGHWVWIGGLSAATGVGLLRVAAGKHFPTDVIAGAGVGSAIAYLFAKIHEVGGESTQQESHSNLLKRLNIALPSVGTGCEVALSF